MVHASFRILLCLFTLLATTPFSESPAKTFTLLILGDSLTEGFGVGESEAFPFLLEKRFKENNLSIKVINGGTSGNTSASGVSTLKWYAKARPDAVVFALGSNDGLRGISLEATKKNLEEAIAFAQEKNWQIYFAGLQIPPNYGKEYTEGFKKIYPDLAKKYKRPLLPFLLKGVAGEAEKNLPDGIHPNAEGHKLIAQNLFVFLRPFLLPTAGK